MRLSLIFHLLLLDYLAIVYGAYALPFYLHYKDSKAHHDDHKEHRKQLEEAADFANKQIDKLHGILNNKDIPVAAYQHHIDYAFGPNADIDEIRQVVKSIHGTKELRVKDILLPVEGVNADASFEHRDIRLMHGFYNKKVEDKAGTLIHEAAHALHPGIHDLFTSDGKFTPTARKDALKDTHYHKGYHDHADFPLLKQNAKNMHQNADSYKLLAHTMFHGFHRTGRQHEVPNMLPPDYPVKANYPFYQYGHPQSADTQHAHDLASAPHLIDGPYEKVHPLRPESMVVAKSQANQKELATNNKLVKNHRPSQGRPSTSGPASVSTSGHAAQGVAGPSRHASTRLHTILEEDGAEGSHHGATTHDGNKLKKDPPVGESPTNHREHHSPTHNGAYHISDIPAPLDHAPSRDSVFSHWSAPPGLSVPSIQAADSGQNQKRKPNTLKKRPTQDRETTYTRSSGKSIFHRKVKGTGLKMAESTGAGHRSVSGSEGKRIAHAHPYHKSMVPPSGHRLSKETHDHATTTGKTAVKEKPKEMRRGIGTKLGRTTPRQSTVPHIVGASKGNAPHTDAKPHVAHVVGKGFTGRRPISASPRRSTKGVGQPRNGRKPTGRKADPSPSQTFFASVPLIDPGKLE
ncbi:unnamed protein product [Cyclocybe aegerita]|uniref:Uncharacterized protein n=1 Tax=Cyclocybe aegerita TaxID=1973307 RepID=A0A8S0VQU3_CYCAE|nr:unnamed protein product [Cyclocybe aegerita]